MGSSWHLLFMHNTVSYEAHHNSDLTLTGNSNAS
jgi:hypothetical protein